MVRSTTHRWTPRSDPRGTPRRAITGLMPGALMRWRYLSWSWPRSPRWLSGRLRGRQAATGGVFLSRGISWVTSLRFPPVGETGSGMPWPSTMRWCLVPGRARSTGLGPLLGPVGRP